MTQYDSLAKLFKVLSDPTRLQILEILSCGTLCACKILERLSINQSTLSHHMKMLTGCGLVKGRKDATWMYYTLNQDRVTELHQLIDSITVPKAECICK
jgi:ArsR family transcriptional regulator